MPIEYTILKDKPAPFERCPKCGAYPFRPFLRGQFQRHPYGFRWRRRPPFFEFFERPYCAVICWACKDIVGYE